jgi:hypothetical protein
MLTSKYSWLAAAVFAASVSGSTGAAFAAAEADSPFASPGGFGQPQATTQAPAYQLQDPSIATVGPDGLMMNGLTPVPPTYG